MKIQLLLTGNEIMSGHTVDSNSAMIADFLAPLGYIIDRKVTIGDELNDLIRELSQLSRDSDIVIVNGGLGPTIDDLTSQALSTVTGQPLETNDMALEHLKVLSERYRLVLNEANLKQTLLPAGVEIIPNPIGTAVGFSIVHNDCLIICTPGVPSELRRMMSDCIVPLIDQRFPNDKAISTLRFQTFGIGESNLQQRVTSEYPDWPPEVELGFRAGMPQLEIKLTIQTPEHQAIQQQCYQRLQTLLGDYIIGEDNTTLAESVIKLLRQRRQTLTTAESCTGGLISAAITEVAGASAVFEAGIVSYSDRMKQQLLAVDGQLLAEHGAVSEAVVVAMAKGALATSDADYAIAVSGIAGPDGGSEDKPVGTVWIAWGNGQQLRSKLLHFKAPRLWFQQMVTATSLDLLRRVLLGIKEEPHYFSSRAGKEQR